MNRQRTEQQGMTTKRAKEQPNKNNRQRRTQKERNWYNPSRNEGDNASKDQYPADRDGSGNLKTNR